MVQVCISFIPKDLWGKNNNVRCNIYSTGTVKTPDLEADLDPDEDDDDPLQPRLVLIVQMRPNQLHQLQAVAQLLVDNLGALADGQVAAGGQVQVLQLLPVPVEVRRVEQVGGEVDEVAQGEDLPGLLEHLVAVELDVGAALQVLGNVLDGVDEALWGGRKANVAYR